MIDDRNKRGNVKRLEHKREKPVNADTKETSESMKRVKPRASTKRAEEKNVEQRGTKSERGGEREMGHPILALTIAHVLPEAHCPLTVGL